MSLVIVLSLCLLLSVSFVSAFWFSDFFEGITGNAISNQTQYTCTDSDGGLNYYVKGYLSSNKPSWENGDFDKCSLYKGNGNYEDTNSCEGSICYLVELSCRSDGEPWRDFIQCSNGCQDGACIIVNQTQTCTDSDGGLDYYVRGYVSTNYNGQNINNKMIDSCMIQDPSYLAQKIGNYSCSGTDCQLLDYYCEGNRGAYSSFYTCPNGCQDGTCVNDNVTEFYKDLLSFNFSSNAECGQFLKKGKFSNGVVYSAFVGCYNYNGSVVEKFLEVEALGENYPLLDVLIKHKVIIDESNKIRLGLLSDCEFEAKTWNADTQWYIEIDPNNVFYNIFLGEGKSIPPKGTYDFHSSYEKYCALSSNEQELYANNLESLNAKYDFDISSTVAFLLFGWNVIENQTQTSAEYPQPFIVNSQADVAIVVGAGAPATDLVAATDLSASLANECAPSCRSDIHVIKDTEIGSSNSKNLIVIGNPCDNNVAKQMLGLSSLPSDLTQCYNYVNSQAGISQGQCLIKITASIYNSNKISMLIFGYRAAETVQGASFVKDFKISIGTQIINISTTQSSNVTVTNETMAYVNPNATTIPLELNESPITACQGCELENKCYPIGYRKNSLYCSDGSFTLQYGSDNACENNFECTSNICAGGKCVSASLLQQIINWFTKLFGSN